MIAVTPRDLEQERLDEQRFAEVAEAAIRELGERVPAGKSFAEFFEKRPVGAAAVLSDLRRKPICAPCLSGCASRRKRAPAPRSTCCRARL